MNGPLDLNDPIADLLRVASTLRTAGGPHAVYGGLALAAYGEPRETKDADLAVAGPDERVGEKALAGSGISVVRAFSAVAFGGHLIITCFTLLGAAGTGGLNTVDLVAPRSTRYAQAAQDRALEGTLST